MKTKRITKKGCKNVHLVLRTKNYGDGYTCDEWMVEKIHSDKPAVYVTKKQYLSKTLILRYKLQFPYPISLE